ncbi:hypothetical protein LAZ67_18001030 [Cordylochernes scorpioides]|uniref:Uncharacterized protein n=1 Tax=Cordylochernes scorpioides TaxID=51811 RepID=A0ABY6LFT3_9ARAC|nr:hypothetical protein LAZ67_18001030 [Cordylochernes scorpioides]
MTTHGHIRPSLNNSIWLNTELLYYPSHPILLNLLPTTFSFTLKLKKVLKGCRFDSIPEIKENTKNILKSLKDEDFQRCFDIWKKRWKKCIDRLQSEVLEPLPATHEKYDPSLLYYFKLELRS